MKCLKIENSKGYYQLEAGTWKEIDQINKNDLICLLDKAVEEDFEMDQFDAEKIPNKAHQIIYRNLFDKLSELSENRTRFKDESEQLYKSAFEKYSTETDDPLLQ